MQERYSSHFVYVYLCVKLEVLIILQQSMQWPRTQVAWVYKAIVYMQLNIGPCMYGHCTWIGGELLFEIQYRRLGLLSAPFL